MASTVDHTPGWGGETGISAREGTRARGAHEKFETPGVEMLSGMQERTILIRKSARACGAARLGSAWPGLAWRGVAAASNTRERSPREFQHAARCAERRRQASDAAKEAAAVIASRRSIGSFAIPPRAVRRSASVHRVLLVNSATKLKWARV